MIGRYSSEQRVQGSSGHFRFLHSAMPVRLSALRQFVAAVLIVACSPVMANEVAAESMAALQSSMELTGSDQRPNDPCPNTIRFDDESSSIMEMDQMAVQRHIALLKEKKTVQVILTGYFDAELQSEYDMALLHSRLAKVGALMRKAGIAPRRIRTALRAPGSGEDDLAAGQCRFIPGRVDIDLSLN